MERAIDEIRQRYEHSKAHFLKECPEYVEALRLAVEAMERQKPMKPVGNFETGGPTLAFNCPECGEFVGTDDCWNEDLGRERYEKAYCECCGQKIDWEDEE